MTWVIFSRFQFLKETHPNAVTLTFVSRLLHSSFHFPVVTFWPINLICYMYVICMFVLFVTGSPATLRFAAGFTHLPLHHVCHLVCNDQQSRWVSWCLSSVAFDCMLSYDYTHCFLSLCAFADYLLQHFHHTGEFSMACCRNKKLIVSTPSLSHVAWSASPKWMATMGKLVVTVGLVLSTCRHLRSIYTLH